MQEKQSKHSDDAGRRARVIDPTRWLEGRVSALIADQRFTAAIDSVHKLIRKVEGDDELCRWAMYLGYLYLVVDEPRQAAHWLRRAREIDPYNPHLNYALGHVAMWQGVPASGALCFLEAFAEADNPHDEAEFLRSAAQAIMSEIGPAASVAGMLLGALDRDLGNPWVLDALARVYEADQRWLESLQTLSTLTEVVRDAAESMVVYRAPPARQLLRNRLMGRSVQPEELQQRARTINEALRDQFEVVLDARQRRGPTGLAPMQFPPALSRLIRILDWRDRGVQLVEAAHGLWARATGEGFDEILGTARLAAALHLLVERLHWRVPTPLSEVARLHGASANAIPAAARVVAGRLGLHCVEEQPLRQSLSLQGQRRLRRLSRALLFGEHLKAVHTEGFRLGG